MGASSGPVVVPPGERTLPSQGQTAGMIREQAFATEDCWVGYVSAQPGTVSGWHHHDGFTTYFFVESGSLRLEFGPEGMETVEGAPGSFVRIPPHTVHRESNPGSDPATIVLFRTGSGTPVVNVDGPEG